MSEHPNHQQVPKDHPLLGKRVLVADERFRLFNYPFAEMEARIAASGVQEKAPESFIDRYAGRPKGVEELNGTLSGRFSSPEPNFRSIPKDAPKECPHGLGYNCRTCYPTMPLSENHYRARRYP